MMIPTYVNVREQMVLYITYFFWEAAPRCCCPRWPPEGPLSLLETSLCFGLEQKMFNSNDFNFFTARYNAILNIFNYQQFINLTIVAHLPTPTMLNLVRYLPSLLNKCYYTSLTFSEKLLHDVGLHDDQLKVPFLSW